MLKKMGLTKLDRYIVNKFLGTFFFSIVLILSVSVVFDLTEKIDDFYEHNASLKAIVFDYYFNFIPYYANLFTSLFTFISVIFFTSKLANNSEIIAMLSSGVSFNRLLRPYFFSAGLIMIFSFFLGSFVIPNSTRQLLAFEHQYIKPFKQSNVRNVQMQVEEGVVMYIERFRVEDNMGYKFSLESFDEKTLISRLTARRVEWDSLYHWKLHDYVLREFDGMREPLTRGEVLDTTISVQPYEFFITADESQQLDLVELKTYIDKQRNRGVGSVTAFEDEYYRRFSTPISVLIMTLMGFSLSSRKVRGGMGVNLGVGLALCGLYVVFITLSSTFAVNKTLPVLLAVWLPNLVFLSTGLYLYMKTPK